MVLPLRKVTTVHKDVSERLKLLNEIGSGPTVITNFNDINSTVTKSNVGT